MMSLPTQSARARLGSRGVHVFDDLREQPFDRSFESRAQKRVHN
jgi:hypothetical protein